MYAGMYVEVKKQIKIQKKKQINKKWFKSQIYVPYFFRCRIIWTGTSGVGGKSPDSKPLGGVIFRNWNSRPKDTERDHKRESLFAKYMKVSWNCLFLALLAIAAPLHNTQLEEYIVWYAKESATAGCLVIVWNKYIGEPKEFCNLRVYYMPCGLYHDCTAWCPALLS